MTNWRDPSQRALFVSEVATISLLGRNEDIERLEELLESASFEDLQRELIQLADIIRRRHDMGLRKDCCESCLRFDACELKWFKTERNMRPTCCPRCQRFHECLTDHQRRTMGKGRRRSERPPTF